MPQCSSLFNGKRFRQHIKTYYLREPSKLRRHVGVARAIVVAYIKPALSGFLQPYIISDLHLEACAAHAIFLGPARRFTFLTIAIGRLLKKRDCNHITTPTCPLEGLEIASVLQTRNGGGA